MRVGTFSISKLMLIDLFLSELNDEEKLVLEKFILEFEHNGVHLSRKETAELHRVQNLYHEKAANYTRSLKEDDESAVLFIEKKDITRFPKVYTNKCREYDANHYVVKVTKHGMLHFYFAFYLQSLK